MGLHPIFAEILEAHMKMVPLRSSNIAAVGYEAATQTMHVTFNHGGTYAYRDVSMEQAKALMDSRSPGSHFHAHVKGRFPESKVQSDG